MAGHDRLRRRFSAACAAPRAREFRDALVEALHGPGLELPPGPAIEPGRYLVGAAGWLVGPRAARPGRWPPQAQQVVLDAGMTEFIRPALYGSRHPRTRSASAGPADGAQGRRAD